MAQDQAIQLNHTYLSAKKYSEASGLDYEHVLYLCKTDQLPCFRTEGGKNFKVRVDKSDLVTKEDYLKLLEENARLKSIIDSINKLSACKN